MDGRWFVFASGDIAQHHRWVVSSEYAIDIAQLGDGMRSHSGDGSRLADYPTFGQPIHAIADGVVVAARDDRIDNEGMLRQPGEAFEAYMQRVAEGQQAIMMSDGFEGAAGNYVLIRHANGEHSLYAHMRQGSLRVRAGDAVSAGVVIWCGGFIGQFDRAAPAFPDHRRARPQSRARFAVCVRRLARRFGSPCRAVTCAQATFLNASDALARRPVDQIGRAPVILSR